LESDRWRGVLVEPQPRFFEKLRQNYKDHAGRLNFLNCAISSSGGEKAFYTVSEFDIERLGLPEIASLDPANIKKHVPTVSADVTKVSTMTFDQVLNKFNMDIVDCVVMDVEGHELSIIENIDFDRYRVKFVMYEHLHLAPHDVCVVEHILIKYGFSLKNFGRYDTIAWRHYSP
jgi:FkbM family methyltransferase